MERDGFAADVDWDWIVGLGSSIGSDWCLCGCFLQKRDRKHRGAVIEDRGDPSYVETNEETGRGPGIWIFCYKLRIEHLGEKGGYGDSQERTAIGMLDN